MPRAEAKDAMRQRLMDAAVEVIAAHGMAGTTIREIARAAEVSEGSVYNHFPSKVELISAVITERMPRMRLREAVKELLDSVGEDPVAALVRFAVAAVEAYAELDQVAGSLISAPETFALVKKRIKDSGLGPARGHQAIAAYLRLEQERGRIGIAGPPEVVGAALAGACHEYAFMRLFHGRTPFGDDLAAFCEQLVGTLVTRVED